MLHNWVAQILEYNLLVIHKPGKLMVIPDTLSHHFVGYHNIETAMDYLTKCFEDIIDFSLNSKSIKMSLSKQKDILQRIELCIEHLECDGIFNIHTLITSPSIAKESGKEDADLNTFDCILIDLPQLAHAQREDNFCSMFIDYHINNIFPKKKFLHQSLEHITYKYWVNEIGILKKINETMPNDHLPPTVFLSKLWHKVCEAYHTSMHAEHQKYKCLYDAIAAFYYFSDMAVVIKGYYVTILSALVFSIWSHFHSLFYQTTDLSLPVLPD